LSQLFFTFVVMNILILLLLSLNFMPSNNTEVVKWYTFQQAIDLQRTKPKKIIVDVYTEWCGWCKKMDASTFTNPAVVKYMNQNFYCVKFNAEGGDTIFIAGQRFTNKNYGKARSVHDFARILLQGNLSYPSYVFMDEKSKGITIVKGYQPKDRWMQYLSYIAKNKYKTMTYDQYNKTKK